MGKTLRLPPTKRSERLCGELSGKLQKFNGRDINSVCLAEIEVVLNRFSRKNRFPLLTPVVLPHGQIHFFPANYTDGEIAMSVLQLLRERRDLSEADIVESLKKAYPHWLPNENGMDVPHGS
jgi:hypothetical protein